MEGGWEEDFRRGTFLPVARGHGFGWGGPAASLRLPQGLEVKRASVLPPEKVSMLIGQLSEPYRTLVMIAATTGLRESELFALKEKILTWRAGH